MRRAAHLVKAVRSLCTLDSPLVADDCERNALDAAQDGVADEALDFIAELVRLEERLSLPRRVSDTLGCKIVDVLAHRS